MEVKGLTWNSLSIGWNPPNDESIAEHIDFYKLTKISGDQKVNIYHPSNKYTFYLWRHLDPATTYTFTVAACNKYTSECGNSSDSVSGTTEDGISGPPDTVKVSCNYDNVSGMNYVDVQWTPPSRKYGKIEFYNVLV